MVPLANLRMWEEKLEEGLGRHNRTRKLESGPEVELLGRSQARE